MKKKQRTKLQFSIFKQMEQPKVDLKVNNDPPKTCPVCKGARELIDDDPKYSEPIRSICWYCKGK